MKKYIKYTVFVIIYLALVFILAAYFVRNGISLI